MDAIYSGCASAIGFIAELHWGWKLAYVVYWPIVYALYMVQLQQRHERINGPFPHAVGFAVPQSAATAWKKKLPVSDRLLAVRAELELTRNYPSPDRRFWDEVLLLACRTAAPWSFINKIRDQVGGKLPATMTPRHFPWHYHLFLIPVVTVVTPVHAIAISIMMAIIALVVGFPVLMFAVLIYVVYLETGGNMELIVSVLICVFCLCLLVIACDIQVNGEAPEISSGVTAAVQTPYLESTAMSSIDVLGLTLEEPKAKPQGGQKSRPQSSANQPGQRTQKAPKKSPPPTQSKGDAERLDLTEVLKKLPRLAKKPQPPQQPTQSKGETESLDLTPMIEAMTGKTTARAIPRTNATAKPIVPADERRPLATRKTVDSGVKKSVPGVSGTVRLSDDQLAKLAVLVADRLAAHRRAAWSNRRARWWKQFVAWAKS